MFIGNGRHLRAIESLALDLYNSVLVIYLSFTSMKLLYVYNLLTNILRAGESLTLDLFTSVLIVYLLFISMKSSYVYNL